MTQQKDNNISFGGKLAEQRNEKDKRQQELENTSPWNAAEKKQEDGVVRNV